MNQTSEMDEFLHEVESRRHEFFRYVLRNVWDSNVAEDVFSSAVLAAWENRHKYTPGTNFRAWMYRILTNKCFVANRETKRAFLPLEETPEATMAAAQEEPGYTDLLDDPEHVMEQCGDEVQRAFRKLSTGERSCILLRGVEGFSYKEIAEILQMPVGTVMTHLARGRAKLRRELVAYAREEGIVKKKGRLVPLDRDTGTDNIQQQRGAEE
jgi:RNA polymerase sigma-70 factor (ECF subfamily)